MDPADDRVWGSCIHCVMLCVDDLWLAEDDYCCYICDWMFDDNNCDDDDSDDYSGGRRALARKLDLETAAEEAALEGTDAHPHPYEYDCRKRQGAAHYARKFKNRTKGRHGVRWQACQEVLYSEQARPAREKAEVSLHAVVDWRVTRVRMGKCTLRGAVTLDQRDAYAAGCARRIPAPTARHHCVRLAPPHAHLMLGSARCTLTAMPPDVRLVVKFASSSVRQFEAGDSAAFWALVRASRDVIRPVLTSGHEVVVMSEDSSAQAAAVVLAYLVRYAGLSFLDAVARVRLARRQLYGDRGCLSTQLLCWIAAVRRM
jgi:hypothetical protein